MSSAWGSFSHNDRQQKRAGALDAEVKSLYSPGLVAATAAAQTDFKPTSSEAFIVTSLGHITHHALTLSGQCAFVRVGLGKDFGKSVVTMRQRQANPGLRALDGSSSEEDWMPPGEGGA
jgi:hypothetical protein